MRIWTYCAPAVVLGCSQRPLLEGISERGRGQLEVVARASGGGAVLAGPWLVGASLALPPRHPWLGGGLLESYRKMAQVHVSALEAFGIAAHALAPAELTRTRAPGPTSAPAWACFGSLSPWELVDDAGRKLVGLAQTRRQTGSLLVAGTLTGPTNWPLLCELMGHPDDARLLGRLTVSIEHLLGRAVDAARFAAVLRQAFEAHLGSCAASAP